MQRVAFIPVGLMSLLLPFTVWATTAQADPVSVATDQSTQFPDTDGAGVLAHGGGVLKVGEYYYWFGEGRSDDNTFHHVSAYRSKDLKTWENRGPVLTQDSAPELKRAVIERPKVIYNKKTGQFVMWMHKENPDDYGPAQAAVAVSSTVDGPYTWKKSFRPADSSGKTHMSRDITLFEDKAHGKAYMISAANHNADLHIYELTDDYTEVKDLVANPWPGQHRESPALFERNGTYFMLTSGTSSWDPNQQKYATASSITGKWSPMKDVGNQNAYDSQTAFVLPVEGSETTSYLYMGDNWAGEGRNPNRVNESTYVWQPLQFPNATTLVLPWYSKVEIDTATGRISGSGGTLNTVTNKNGGHCMTVAGSDSDNGVKAVQGDCGGGLNGQWRLTHEHRGYVHLVAQHSGKCMDVAGKSFDDGAEVVQYNCVESDNQKWRSEDLGDGYVRVIAAHSQKCLDVQERSAEAGARLVQRTCNGAASQAWKFDTVAPGGGSGPSGSVDQEIGTSVNAGNLSMASAADAVRLAAVGFGKGGSSTGRLNSVIVKDFRGGGAGWSLTGKITDFSSPRGTIVADRLSWTPTCTTETDSPSVCQAGTPGKIGKDGATLASAPDGAVTGGEFTADAAVKLDIPKFAPVANYSATLTLTLL